MTTLTGPLIPRTIINSKVPSTLKPCRLLTFEPQTSHDLVLLTSRHSSSSTFWRNCFLIQTGHNLFLLTRLHTCIKPSFLITEWILTSCFVQKKEIQYLRTRYADREVQKKLTYVRRLYFLSEIFSYACLRSSSQRRQIPLDLAA